MYSVSVNVSSIVPVPQGHTSGLDAGPVWTPGAETWGDIIPPFDYGDGRHFSGQNWTDAGQAIYRNGCVPPTLVTPVTPTVTQSHCDDGVATDATYTVPVTEGVIYSLNGTPITGVQHVVAGTGTTVTLTVAADDGYTLTSSAPIVLTINAAPLHCSPVRPVTPTVTQSSCVNGSPSDATFTVGPTEGVVYSIDDSVVSGLQTVTPGAFGKTVIIDVAAASGYTLASDASIHLTINPAPTCGTVTKTNNADPSNEGYNVDEVASAPNLPVPFKLHITNTSPFPVIVSSVTDQVGETSPVGVTCLPALPQLAAHGLAGDSADCLFTLDSYSPPDGQTKTDVARVFFTRVQLEDLRRAHVRRAAVTIAPTATSNPSTVTTHVPVIVPSSPPSNPGVPDLAISKTGPSGVSPGSSLAYTLTVTNTGTAAASGVHVDDSLPSGLTLVSVAGTGWTCASGTSVSCNLAGSLPAGGTASLTVSASLASGYTAGTVVNTATVTPTDGTPNDNSSTATTPVTANDLGITKTGPASAARGDELVYTLTVTNVKGDPATHFSISDQLPAGLAFSSATGTDFTCSQTAGTIVCDYAGTLPVGSSAQVVVRALLLDTFVGTDVTNTAVVDPGRADGDASNNSGSATTAVTTPLTGGGGGGATQPTPAPSVSPTPITGGGGGGATGLPFTGSYADQMLQLGVTLLLVGLLLALAARRREGTAD